MIFIYAENDLYDKTRNMQKERCNYDGRFSAYRFQGLRVLGLGFVFLGFRGRGFRVESK